MKKLLSLLGAMGLVATSGSVAVACNKGDKNTTTKDLSTIKGDDLKLTPETNTKEAAVTAAVAKIKAKLSVDVVLDTDFTVGEKDFTEATSKAAGSLKITAKSGSKVLTEGKTVTFSLAFKAEGTTKPVMALSDKDSKIKNNAVEIAMPQSGNGTIEVIITVTNPVAEKVVTVSVAEQSEDKLSAGEVSAVPDQSGQFKVTLTSKDKISEAVNVTFNYEGADAVVLAVTASERASQ
ncbi:lipoprotein [Spiroplasma tabanidicola]|uniref:Spiralin n=1 Tax=Spiroplasma tabanidicola TaxID=324079 RepID=A0A6I6C5K9_9MOLU|nr:lipoprotein [Spiroplasma tabanidicola]QGS51420.1 hypothetical protein STABA_v1c00530 [Spiroplasma tabanidicola]